MKNAIKVLCFVLAVLIIGTASVYVYFTWDKGEFLYVDGTEKGTVTITSYEGNSVNIVIPDRLRGKKVTSIDISAFNGSDIVSVKINKYITSIGQNAFQNCKKLETVVLGESTRSIGEGSFSNCTALKTVTITPSVEKIGVVAFGNDSALEKIDFSGNSNFVCEDGIIYSSDKTVVYEALPYADLSDYVCPSTVKEFKNFAFSGHNEMTSFTIPSEVHILPEGVFSNCKGLKQLIIPQNVKEIGAMIVTGSAVTDISIPKATIKINDAAFYNMENQLTITTVENSTASVFAKEKKIKVKIVNSL